ncbi:dihydrolipoyl dehydrogenase [Pseudomonas sp. NPDC007930]|uniref:dihydrolipoyl dehydrogenase n=1 Tax=Pseudomonas sp. NPDC007930 TaxID=3364417 RepID=UPI0036E5D000
MATLTTQLLVLGGGPGGYVAAIRAGQLGIATTLVEAQALGGTCLNVGCIPSKALLHLAEQLHASAHGSALGIRYHGVSFDLAQAMHWKNSLVDRLTSGVASLLKKHKVNVIHGHGQVLDGKTVQVGDTRIHCEHLLLATGSRSAALPALPLGGAVVGSGEALAPTSLPRQLCVVGAGYIGLELGTAYRKLGAEVTLIEAQPRILPSYDAELSQPVAGRLEALGIGVRLGEKVSGFDGTSLRLESGERLPCDRVLVAVGRVPNTEGYGLEGLQLAMNGRAVAVDGQCRTSMRNVWAIGDLTGEPMLAHRAMAQAEVVAALIAGQPRRFDPVSIPAVCYTDPEVVAAGLSPEQAGAGHRVASFPFAANGRALTLQAGGGFVRVVAREADQVIVGWQAVGAGVSELAAAFGQSLEMGARLQDIAATVHAHPTLGEAIQEAALKALGKALHA